MMIRPFVFGCLGLLFSALSTLTNAEDVLVVTENYPPFNYKEDSSIKGIATERVRQIMDKSGLSYRILLLPWTRAFAMATSQNTDNVLIYSLTRTPERETQFEWLAQISPADSYLYALPEVAESAKGGLPVDQARATCVFDDAACNMLRSLGFTGKNLIEVADNESASEIRMVEAGRAEFFVANPIYLPYRLKQLKIPESTFTAVKLVRTGQGYYLAGPRHLHPDIAEKVRQALSALQQ
ncbi:MAG: transporter substrate-binding domain-containing protein [Hahellaceae bacterium]|nr:transporter substrate-binding domain-containing protein [Hahellaceae bacterium]